MIKRKALLTIFVSDQEFEQVKQLGLSYQVLIDNWNNYYDKLPKMTDAELQESAQLEVQVFMA